MRAVRRAAKAFLHRAGLFRLRAARRLNGTLTVLMYHRVLPAADPRRLASFDEYVLGDQAFAASLDVVEAVHRPVALGDVLAALEGRSRLPPRAALLTFDDGWLDTLEVAAPELARRGLPSVVFVPPAVFDDDEPFWQERLLLGVRTGRIGHDTLRELARAAGLAVRASAPAPLLSLIAKLTDLPREERAGMLRGVAGVREAGQPFLRPGDLPRLRALGVDIGAHGLTHEALTTVPDPMAELVRSRAILSELAGVPVEAMSFPHGRYDAPIAAQAFAAGYRAVFTSDAVINRLPSNPAAGALFGRLGVYPGAARRGELAADLTGRPIEDVRTTA
jgi:peptidoglycan/xylan/chitin deacetylase (PgdA/CDA1 family)